VLNTVSVQPLRLEPVDYNYADTSMDHDDATINLLTSFLLMEDGAADQPAFVLANADLSVFDGGK
jgi:hypothetical protein